MGFYRNLQTLLEVTEPSPENQISNAHAVIPSDSDGIPDHLTSWMVFIDVSQTGGGTAPTTDLEVQTSHGDNKWVTVASATQLTGDGEQHEFKEISALGPFIRVKTTLGGTPKPGHTATVKLASNAPFKLVLAG